MTRQPVAESRGLWCYVRMRPQAGLPLADDEHPHHAARVLRERLVAGDGGQHPGQLGLAVEGADGDGQADRIGRGLHGPVRPAQHGPVGCGQLKPDHAGLAEVRGVARQVNLGLAVHLLLV